MDRLTHERHQIALPYVQHWADRQLHMAVLELIRLQQSDKMQRRRDGHGDMEELMRGAENVAHAWFRTFRPLKLRPTSVCFGVNMEAKTEYANCERGRPERTEKATKPSA